MSKCVSQHQEGVRKPTFPSNNRQLYLQRSFIVTSKADTPIELWSNS